MYRTHTCGELRLANVNETVCLSGWVQKIRNLGAMTFIDLRDRYGITQLVVEESAPNLSFRLPEKWWSVPVKITKFLPGKLKS